jgi:hypothetical protein
MKINGFKALTLGAALLAGGIGVSLAQSTGKNTGEFDINADLLGSTIADITGLPSFDNLSVVASASDTIVYVDGKGKISGFTLLSLADATLVVNLTGSMGNSGTTPSVTMNMKGRGANMQGNVQKSATFSGTFKGTLATTTTITPIATNTTYATNFVCASNVVLYCTNYTATQPDATNAIQLGTVHTNLPGSPFAVTNCDSTLVTGVVVTVTVTNGFCTNYTAVTSGTPGALPLGFPETNGVGGTNYVITNTCPTAAVITNTNGNFFTQLAVALTATTDTPTNWFAFLAVPQATNCVATNTVITTNTVVTYQTNTSAAMTGNINANANSGVKGDKTVQFKNVAASITDVIVNENIPMDVHGVYMDRTFDTEGTLFTAGDDQLSVWGQGSANTKGQFTLNLKGVGWGVGSSVTVKGTGTSFDSIDLTTLSSSGKIMNQKVKGTTSQPH